MYNKQIWENLPSNATKVTAARMNHIEDGIYQNSQDIATVITNLSKCGKRELLWSGSSVGGSSITFDTTKYTQYEMITSSGAFVKGIIANGHLMAAGGSALNTSGTTWIPGITVAYFDVYADHFYCFSCIEYDLSGNPYNRTITKIYGIA